MTKEITPVYFSVILLLGKQPQYTEQQRDFLVHQEKIHDKQSQYTRQSHDTMIKGLGYTILELYCPYDEHSQLTFYVTCVIKILERISFLRDCFCAPLNSNFEGRIGTHNYLDIVTILGKRDLITLNLYPPFQYL